MNNRANFWEEGGLGEGSRSLTYQRALSIAELYEPRVSWE